MAELNKTGLLRREFLIGAAGAVAATALWPSEVGAASRPGAEGSLRGLTIQKVDTAVVFIDPQNDVLSEHGSSWAATGASVIENKTRENMERIFKAAKAKDY